VTSERRERIALLVDEALDLPPDRREAFVAARCPDDEAIRREVKELLAADEDMASSFLEQPASRGLGVHEVGAEEPCGPDPMVGRLIGAYRLEALLGRGGMGAVYLARRADDEYEHQVAVKLLHPGFASAGLVRRLRSERQILARLDHPNIAKLLDGGTAEDGQPYLVMELITGMRIDAYCDEHGLGVRERLLLFRQICDAVQFAHQNLVVHRDLKPSNIMVTAQGTPKLLDFGIAKLVEAPPLLHNGDVTQSLLHAMTPSYASPEQLAGRNVTTVSDVYSLGVILYKLLTGRLPRRVDLRSPQALQADLAREPEKPSAAASREDDEISETSSGSRQRPDARQLRRQLGGDLDTIVLMALRTEPERRYGSVEQLADDLDRHLDGLPVRARRGTFTYRTGKFLRRNRLAVSAAAVIFGLVIGLAATATLQARRIAREREVAEQQRGRAERERDKAQRVAEFMADLFATAGNTQGITARQLLDQGAAKLYGELAGDDPEVRATLLAAIGKVYAVMGLEIEAKPHLEEALRSRERLFGPDHLEVAEVANRLGWLTQYGSDLAAAEKHARRALRIRQQQLAPDDPLVADSLISLAAVYHSLQRLAAAEELMTRGLRIKERHVGPKAEEDLAATYDLLGLIHRDQGRPAEAEAAFRRSLAIAEGRFGRDHPASSSTLNNLALVLHDRGLLAEAATFYRRSIDLKERSDGPTPRLAASLFNLALLERTLGEYTRAERRYARAQEIIETTVGPENVYVAMIVAGRGLIHRDRGELELAGSLVQRGLRMAEATGGSGHRRVAELLLRMASIDFRRGRLRAAAAAQERALRIFRQQQPLIEAEVSAATRDLAQVVARQGDSRRAASLLAEVVAATEERLKKQPQGREEPVLLASALLESGRLAAAAGDQQAAASRFGRALELVEPFAADSQVIEHARVYAEALVLLGRVDEARPTVERLLSTGWRDPRFLSLMRDHGLATRTDPRS
jgi:serine/threonine-protein kinase